MQKKVRQFNLATAFDVSTGGGGAAEETCELTFDHRAGSDDADMTNLKFNADGTKFFIVDTHNDQGERIDVYTLTTAYDISTCVHE